MAVSLLAWQPSIGFGACPNVDRVVADPKTDDERKPLRALKPA